MGDIMSLIELAEQAVDKTALELERKLHKSEFVGRLCDQLPNRKMGPLDQLVDMLPKVGPLQNIPKDASVDEQIDKSTIINSMTNQGASITTSSTANDSTS
jgi:signal recognition particle subunit SRP54